MKKIAIVALCAAFIAATGCASPPPKPELTPTPYFSDRLAETPPLATERMTPPVSLSPGETPRPEPTVVIVAKITGRIREIDGVTAAVVAVSDTKCVIGVKLDEGETLAENVDIIRDAAKSVEPELTEIAITDDAGVYEEIEQIVTKEPGDIAAKVDELLQRIQ